MQSWHDKIWEAAQRLLRETLNPETYRLWFASLRVHSCQDEVLVLEVVDDFCEVWLTENYHGLIREMVFKACGKPLEVQFKVRPGGNQMSGQEEPAQAAANAGNGASASPVASVTESPQEIPDNLLNGKSTFDTFVVGSNNTFAHAAALAVAQAPGMSYNPLFIYSGVGLGKTHLLCAIADYVQKHRRNAKITYVTTEKFTNEFIDAIQNSSLVKFRRKYRQSDVFLIDDIQFLQGKERIQEEFFHTFNSLHEAHKQIVLTCDRPAGSIQGLEHRLVSRFEWGLMVDMQPPDVETRLAILRKKEKVLKVEMPEEILTFLAQRVRSNIRRLEGALVRVVSYQSITGKKLTTLQVEDLLRDMLHEETRTTLTIEAIQKLVADHFELRLADMCGRKRPESIAFPRQIAMWLARKQTENSLTQIGEAFGGRDHGTVLHAVRQVDNRMQTDAEVRRTVQHLQNKLMR